MTAQEAEIYPWSELNPAERLSEEHGSTGGANPATGFRLEGGGRLVLVSEDVKPKITKRTPSPCLSSKTSIVCLSFQNKRRWQTDI